MTALKPLPPPRRTDTEARVRRFVISIFEIVCLAFVAVPTVLCAVVTIFAVAAGGGTAGFSALVTLAVLVATSFIAGGALTLVDIAHNTRQTTVLLRALQDRP
jgi:hypothetical protein